MNNLKVTTTKFLKTWRFAGIHKVKLKLSWLSDQSEDKKPGLKVVIFHPKLWKPLVIGRCFIWEPSLSSDEPTLAEKASERVQSSNRKRHPKHLWNTLFYAKCQKISKMPVEKTSETLTLSKSCFYFLNGAIWKSFRERKFSQMGNSSRQWQSMQSTEMRTKSVIAKLATRIIISQTFWTKTSTDAERSSGKEIGEIDL